ncbi:MAG TPA: hypothetical protein VF807_05740 [Ktedonobacterales bacterium]
MKDTAIARIPASPRYDWIATILATWFTGGLFLDGWAHTHGRVDTTFFTPWHAVLYSAWAANGLFLAGTFVLAVRRGMPWRIAMPCGYHASLIGAVVFGVGGVLDLTWHLIFGVEKATEALLSPTHLTLATGLILVVSSPYRSALQRVTSRPSLLVFLPVLLSLTYSMSAAMFFLQYANPIVSSYADQAFNGSDVNQLHLKVGLASIILHSALVSGAMLVAISHWRIPFGSFAIMLAINGVLIDSQAEKPLFLSVGLLAGLAGLLVDLLYLWLRPSETGVWSLRLFAFLAPAMFFLLYFVALGALKGGIVWSVPLWTGSIFEAGVVGLLLSFLLLRTAPGEPLVPAGP